MGWRMGSRSAVDCLNNRDKSMMCVSLGLFLMSSKIQQKQIFSGR